jgi:hypothetical protein
MKDIHVGTRLTALALALGIVSVVGCLLSSKSDPLADAEKMVGSHSGANTVITAANADSVTSDIMDAVSSGVGRALQQSNAGDLFSKPARQATSVNVDLSAPEIHGLVSGTVKLKSGHVTANSNETTGYGTMSVNVAIEFNDFSDDGVIFLGGTFEESANVSFQAAGMTLDASAKANIAVSGKHQGSMSMDVTVTETNGVASVSGTVTVGGQTVHVTNLPVSGM